MALNWDDAVDSASVYDAAESFVGGQFSYAKARELQPNQSALLQDCEEEITGQVSTRYGTGLVGGAVGASTVKVDAIGFYNFSPTYVYEVAICNAVIYRNNGGTWTSIGTAANVGSYATDTVTAAGAPANNDTVTVNGRVYTFKTALTPAANEILINGQDGSLTNLASAINRTGTAGTDYGAATTINADVASSAVAAHVITLTAKSGGTSGNSLTLAKSSSNLTIGSSTFSGAVGFSVSDTPSMAQGVNKMYFAAGGDIFSWDGASWANISGDTTNPNGTAKAPRNVSFVRWHGNRLVAAGPSIKELSTDTNPIPDALYMSDALVPSDWGNLSKNTVQLRPGNGDGIPITAIVPWTNFNLAVFKRRSVWIVEADPSMAIGDMPIQQVHGSGTVGCVARRSAVQVGADILFLSDDGIRSLASVVGSDQQFELSVPLSFPVQDVIDRINWTSAAGAAATYWRNLYVIALPLDGSSTNNYVLVYNTVTKAWSGLWTNLPIYHFAIREVSGVPRLMMAHASTNKVLEYLDYVNPSNWAASTFRDYDASDVQPRIKTRAFVFSDKISLKLGLGGEIEWNNSNGTLSLTPILDEVPKTPISITIGSGGFTVPLVISGGGIFTISPNGLARQQFDLMQYGEFRELQFDITGSGTGRKELRQIALSGVVRPTLVGNS